MNFIATLGLFQGLLLSLKDHLFQTVYLRQSVTKRLPKPQGSHHVGCFDLMTKNSPDGIFLRIFYPTSNQQLSTSPEVKWVTHSNYVDGLATFTKIWPRLFRILYRIVVGNMYSQVAWKAPPLRQHNGWPLILFSHGLGGCRTTYSTLCTELASHGFVVAATEHRDHTACRSFYLNDSGEQWLEYRRVKPGELEYPFRNGQVHKRAAECTEALSTLLNLNEGERITNVLDPNFSSEWFKGLIDSGRVALMGHSFGAATIVTTFANDKRFKVGVALDAWMYPVRLEDESKVKQPLLFVNMEKFQTPVNIKSMKRFASVNVDREIVTLVGGVHQNVSDVPFLSKNRKMHSFFIANSSLEPLLAMELIAATSLRFVWEHLGMEADKVYLEKLRDHHELLVSELLNLEKVSINLLFKLNIK
ncbi:Platelet-activating factor acetylhydrolase [Chamberlinius hualienensis]